MLRLYSKYTHNLLSTSSFFILLLLLSPPSNLHHHLHHHNQREKRDSLLLVEAIAMGQGISTAQWFTYGRRHFTKTGYIRHVKDYRIENGLTNKNQWQQNQKPPQSRPDTPRGVDDDDGINLRGKVVVITGANSGLGYELTTYAATKGAKVYMICRSEERASKARDGILQRIKEAKLLVDGMSSESSSSKKENGNDKITNNDDVDIRMILADVGELDQVRRAVSEIQAIEDNIDVLICNAGALLNERVTTSALYEKTFATHLLGGSFLLTKLLLPQLRKRRQQAQAGRVVFVTSGGMLLTKFPKWDVATSNIDNKIDYDGVMAYSYAKRGQVLLAERMASDFPKDEVTFASVHPGWVRTAAVADAFGKKADYLEPMRDVWEGAEGIAWLAFSARDSLSSSEKAAARDDGNDNTIVNGAFYLDRMIQKKHIAGLFMTEGSYTKNTEEEVDQLMEQLEKACDV